MILSSTRHTYLKLSPTVIQSMLAQVVACSPLQDVTELLPQSLAISCRTTKTHVNCCLSTTAVNAINFIRLNSQSGYEHRLPSLLIETSVHSSTQVAIGSHYQGYSTSNRVSVHTHRPQYNLRHLLLPRNTVHHAHVFTRYRRLDCSL